MTVVQVDDLMLTDESGFACSKTKLVDVGLPHLRPFNISDDGSLYLGDIYQVPIEEAPDSKRELLPGDVLFNNTNSVELVGKSTIVRERMVAGYSNHITRIRVNAERIEPEYFALWLRQLRSTGFFSSQATQWVSQAAFRASELRKLALVLPEPSEQRRIVNLLTHAEGIVRAVEFHAAGEVDGGDEAQAVGQFVHHGIEQVNRAGRGIAIQPVVPAQGRQAAALADAAVEGGIDVVAVGVQIGTSQGVGEGSRVIGVGQRGAGEISENGNRPGRPKDSRAAGAGEGIESRSDADRHGADQPGAPELGGAIENVQALLANGDPGVAADRRHRGRVIKSLPRAVEVDDRNRARPGDGRPPDEHRQGETLKKTNGHDAKRHEWPYGVELGETTGLGAVSR